jgi:hypothetical protein
MKRLAILTALTMAASSTAYADHDRDRDYPDYRSNPDRGFFGDFVYGPYSSGYDQADSYGRDQRPGYRGGWVPLADYRSQRSEINLMSLERPFRRIRVEAVSGAPLIKQVTIEYMDDTAQVVQLDVRLPRGAVQDIRLNNRHTPVKRVIVYGDPNYGGEYSLFGT